MTDSNDKNNIERVQNAVKRIKGPECEEGGENVPWECDDCRETFDTERGLNIHRGRVHNNEEKTETVDEVEFEWRNETNTIAIARVPMDFNSRGVSTMVSVEKLKQLIELAHAMEWTQVELAVADDRPVIIRKGDDPEKAVMLAPRVKK